jgi:hypothetical protein
MTKGVLLFAHNSTSVDYGMLAIIAGGLAKKHLKVPVSLVADTGTLAWLEQSGSMKKAKKVFDKIISIDLPHTTNKRHLHDGFSSQVIPFINSNRCDAWELTPYDTTLLIDSDFLIFSNKLNEYWEVDASVMVAKSMNDLKGGRTKILDERVSETGIHLFWATTVMFKKDKESKFFFQLIEYIRDNYVYFSDLFRFNSKQYRNDIAFSIAKHIMNGFETSSAYTLPPLTTISDQDILIDVDKKGKLIVTMDEQNTGNYTAASVQGTDIHIMNKQSILRNKDALMRLI